MLKPTGSFRLLVGISGLLGVAALAVYYSVPIPVPPPNAGFREIAEFGTQFHDKILLDAWLQGIGSLLVVIFFLALVYLAQRIERFSGWITTWERRRFLQRPFSMSHLCWALCREPWTGIPRLRSLALI